MSFWGITSHCKQWILNYAEIEAPLTAIAHGIGPPILGLPEPIGPFIQTVDKINRYMTSVLLQEHRGRRRPVAYFSENQLASEL